MNTEENTNSHHMSPTEERKTEVLFITSTLIGVATIVLLAVSAYYGIVKF